MNPVFEIIVGVRKSINQVLFFCIFREDVLEMCDNLSDWKFLSILRSQQFLLKSSHIWLKLNIDHLVLAF